MRPGCSPISLQLASSLVAQIRRSTGWGLSVIGFWPITKPVQCCIANIPMHSTIYSTSLRGLRHWRRLLAGSKSFSDRTGINLDFVHRERRRLSWHLDDRVLLWLERLNEIWTVNVVYQNFELVCNDTRFMVPVVDLCAEESNPKPGHWQWLRGNFGSVRKCTSSVCRKLEHAQCCESTTMMLIVPRTR